VLDVIHTPFATSLMYTVDLLRGLSNAQLFFDVCAMKTPSCGRTFELLHFGHFTLPFSRSKMVKINSNGFLHFSHMNS
jgi:hypothetical protein